MVVTGFSVLRIQFVVHTTKVQTVAKLQSNRKRVEAEGGALLKTMLHNSLRYVCCTLRTRLFIARPSATAAAVYKCGPFPYLRISAVVAIKDEDAVYY